MCAESGRHSLGARLRLLRRQAKLTQAQLAEHANISCVYVNKLERGLAMPSIQVLQRLAQSLNTDAASLLAVEETVPSAPANGGASPYLALYLSGVAPKMRRLVFETMDQPIPPTSPLGKAK